MKAPTGNPVKATAKGMRKIDSNVEDEEDDRVKIELRLKLNLGVA